MGYQFPYNADTQVMSPVRVHSRLRQGKASYLVLKEPFNAETAKGSPWEGSILVTEKKLINGNKAAQFSVALKDSLSLSRFKDLVLGRKPVVIDVTLVPDTQGSSPGAPPALPPVTKQAQVAIPSIAPAKIEVNVESVTMPEPGTYVKARVSLPPFVKAAGTETMAMMKSIGFMGDSSAMTLESVTEQGEWRIALFRPAEGVSLETIAGGSYHVMVTAMAVGIPLRQEVSISFRMQRHLVLQLSKESIIVNEKKSASFLAAVWDIDESGVYQPVPEASLSVLPGGQGELAVTPLSGSGSIEFTVSLIKKTEQKSAAVTVTAKADKSKFSEQVAVVIGDVPLAGDLEVEFVPPDKNEIDPALRGDVVTLRARVKPPETGEFDAEAFGKAQKSVVFEKNGNDEWIDGPSGTVPAAEWWVHANVGASSPDPSRNLAVPPSIGIVVRAALGDRQLSKDVTIGLLQPPELAVTPEELKFLAKPPSDPKIKADDKEKKVILTVMNAGKASWSYSLTADDETKKLVTVSGPKREGRGAVFAVTAVKQPDETPQGEKPTWKISGRLATKAADGTRKVEGRDVIVSVLREGLFVEKVYTLQKSGAYKYDPAITTVPVRVDLPLDNQLRVTKVKFAAMKWNGTELVQDDELADDRHLSFGEVAGDDPKAKAFVKLFKLEVKYNEDSDVYSYLNKTWSFFIDRMIPGRGERIAATIEATSKIGTLAVPLEFVTAKPDAKTGSIQVEKEKCIKLMKACIPPDRYIDILKDMNSLASPGADDYRVFRDKIWETAWKIWAEDQKDYQYWDNGWGKYLIYGAEGLKMAGDLSFMLVVGYYTSHLGPVKAFGVSTVAATFKDTAIEFYAYYIERGNGRSLSEVGWEYASSNYQEFLIANGATVVDMFILHGFDPKNPATYRKFAWLWIWKVSFHWAHDTNEKKERLGLLNALYAGTKDVFHMAFIMVLQEFVNKNAEKSMGELWDSFRKRVNRAAKGEKLQGPEDGEGGKKADKEKADKEKADKEKADKEKA
ncbi:MAG: hypothetical protein RDV48_01005, partial [Candidatus Eremiobacteraeota bacterium]|nr:hypothetical protein [Candidatus Eremiobacteraeota bacterium]